MLLYDLSLEYEKLNDMENLKEYFWKLKIEMELKTINEVQLEFISPTYYINFIEPEIIRLQ